MYIQIWLLPTILFISAILLSIPLSQYLAWIIEGKYRPLPILCWGEKSLNMTSQTWKQYMASLLLFNIVLFIFSYLILSLQPWMPLNPDGKTLLAPSAIFQSVAAFITNTDLQHYSGEQHLSNFSQILFGITNLFISAAIGLCSLIAFIRALRGEALVGNFFLDMWRVVVYVFVPVAFIVAIIFISQGSPMTYKSIYQVTTLEQLKTQNIALGPVAAFESIKMLGTNGGGFYGMNSAHPFENPTGLSNFFNTLTMMIFPFSLILLYGIMLKQIRHSIIMYAVMLLLTIITVVWTIYFDTLKPNPAFTYHPQKHYSFFAPSHPDKKISITIPDISALPIDQHLGNLEGKEIRFGTSAAATFTALTADVNCGAVNSELDSINPLASLAPMMGIWLGCLFGGKGVGVINMLMFIIMGIFLAGMMVGRTPEYLGKKIEAREVKFVIIGLLVHSFFTLLPLGLFAATSWGMNAISNPGPHGLSQMLYQFSSASGNNGSAFSGLNVTYGFWNNPTPSSEAFYWDIATGLIIIFSRFLPIIVMVAMAAYLGEKKPSPLGMGTLRIDSFTFGMLLLGTIIIVGALQFFPVAILGPIAEQLGPIPFGRELL